MSDELFECRAENAKMRAALEGVGMNWKVGAPYGLDNAAEALSSSPPEALEAVRKAQHALNNYNPSFCGCHDSGECPDHLEAVAALKKHFGEVSTTVDYSTKLDNSIRLDNKFEYVIVFKGPDDKVFYSTPYRALLAFREVSNDESNYKILCLKNREEE